MELIFDYNGTFEAPKRCREVKNAHQDYAQTLPTGVFLRLCTVWTIFRAFSYRFDMHLGCILIPHKLLSGIQAFQNVSVLHYFEFYFVWLVGGTQ